MSVSPLTQLASNEPHRRRGMIPKGIAWTLAIGVAILGMSATFARIANAAEPKTLVGEFCFEKAPFPSCHASSIVEVAPGELLVTYFAGTDEGEKDVGIWLSRGKVDSRQRVVWEPPVKAHQEPEVPCWNPVLFLPKGGELLLFFKAGPSPSTWSGFVKSSKDGGRTWGPATLLPAGILGPVRSKPVQMPDGRLICGSSMESYHAWGCWVETFSPKDGSWSKQGPINAPGHLYGTIQPSVFTTSKGLAFVCRSRGLGKICRSESNDGGKTWSPAEPMDLPNPNSGVDAVTLSDGKVAMIYNHTAKGRTPLNIAVSSDDGKTFSPAFVLENEPGEYSYPAIIQTADGRLHCSYTWHRKRVKHVSFDPSDLTAPSGN